MSPACIHCTIITQDICGPSSLFCVYMISDRLSTCKVYSWSGWRSGSLVDFCLRSAFHRGHKGVLVPRCDGSACGTYIQKLTWILSHTLDRMPRRCLGAVGFCAVPKCRHYGTNFYTYSREKARHHGKYLYASSVYTWRHKNVGRMDRWNENLDFSDSLLLPLLLELFQFALKNEDGCLRSLFQTISIGRLRLLEDLVNDVQSIKLIWKIVHDSTRKYDNLGLLSQTSILNYSLADFTLWQGARTVTLTFWI